jgi:hypothetical protein
MRNQYQGRDREMGSDARQVICDDVPDTAEADASWTQTWLWAVYVVSVVFWKVVYCLELLLSEYVVIAANCLRQAIQAQ